MERDIRTGNHLQFQVSALGRAARGSIDVAEDYVRLVVFMPWRLWRRLPSSFSLIRKEGTLLLEKK
jgi:hypothetical protein